MPDPDLRFTWFQEPCRLEDARGHRLPIPSEFGIGVSISRRNCMRLANFDVFVACSSRH
jgi:hypothetical protein